MAIEVRSFLKDPVLRETEARLIDLDADGPDVLFPKGTVFTCTDGHEICEAAHHIRHFQQVMASDLHRWREGHPVMRDWDPALPCQECGAQWAIATTGGASMHTKDRGWLPPMDESTLPERWWTPNVADWPDHIREYHLGKREDLARIAFQPDPDDFGPSGTIVWAIGCVALLVALLVAFGLWGLLT